MYLYKSTLIGMHMNLLHFYPQIDNTLIAIAYVSHSHPYTDITKESSVGSNEYKNNNN